MTLHRATTACRKDSTISTDSNSGSHQGTIQQRMGAANVSHHKSKEFCLQGRFRQEGWQPGRSSVTGAGSRKTVTLHQEVWIQCIQSAWKFSPLIDDIQSTKAINVKVLCEGGYPSDACSDAHRCPFLQCDLYLSAARHTGDEDRAAQKYRSNEAGAKLIGIPPAISGIVHHPQKNSVVPSPPAIFGIVHPQESFVVLERVRTHCMHKQCPQSCTCASMLHMPWQCHMQEQQEGSISNPSVRILASFMLLEP
eukprot:1156789-Pelagomonas_calceolata.AAC.5